MPMMDSAAGKAIMYGLPAISFAFMSFMPSALQLYFVATGMFGLAQTYVINSPTFRRWVGMTMSKKSTGEPKLEISPNIQSKGLRATMLRIEEEKAALRKAREQNFVQPQQESTGKISWIDNVMNQGKDMGKNLSKEISEKFGTSSIEQRQRNEQKKRAGEYEGERRTEDDAMRAERNEIRRKEHMKILENERTKASKSWKASKDGQRGPRRG
jgi:YidC/Oxa1 family membrane protein insertase